jgi:hypothetical protein
MIFVLIDYVILLQSLISLFFLSIYILIPILYNTIMDKEYSPLFLKLRAQSIRQVTELMDSTLTSMNRVEKSMERINASTTGVFSTARIWSSFYDPRVVEKLKQESVQEEK